MSRSALAVILNAAKQVRHEDVIQSILRLSADAWHERSLSTPDSPEWYKLTGEILGYSKLLAEFS
jgi:hypothetical protein